MLHTLWIVAIIFLRGSYMFFSNLLPVVAVTERNPLQWGWGEGGTGHCHSASWLLFLCLSQNLSVVREQYADLLFVVCSFSLFYRAYSFAMTSWTSNDYISSVAVRKAALSWITLSGSSSILWVKFFLKVFFYILWHHLRVRWQYLFPY